MTSRVRSLGPEAKLSEVRRLLQEESCHHVPIVEDGELIGIVSSRDLLRLLREAKAKGDGDLDAVLDGRASLSEVMSHVPVTLGLDESVDRAIDLIADGAIHSVLVLDAEGRLAGIVTDTDLLAYLG